MDCLPTVDVNIVVTVSPLFGRSALHSSIQMSTVDNERQRQRQTQTEIANVMCLTLCVNHGGQILTFVIQNCSLQLRQFDCFEWEYSTKTDVEPTMVETETAAAIVSVISEMC